MGEVEAVVERAVTASEAPDGEWQRHLRALTAERRSRLHAAFAYAKRRAQDPRLSAAADVLELALVADRRGTFTGARWWHRVEVVLGLLFVVNTFNLLAQAVRLGWWALLPVLLFLAVSVGLLHTWWSRVVAGEVAAPPTMVKPASAGRIPQVADRVLRRGRAAVQAGDHGREALATVVRQAATSTPGPRGHVFAVAGLSYAERLLAASLGTDRKVLRDAVRTAREDMLAQGPGATW